MGGDRQVPLYFFHLMDGRIDRDLEGSELPDLTAAQDEAVVFLGQTIKDRPGILKDTGELRVEVTGEDGSLLKTVIIHAIDPVGSEAIKKQLQN